MNPAFSVIFLTTLLGVGQGLFLAMYAAELLGFAGAFQLPDSRSFFAAGSALVLLFLGAGLTASFFHLGHPERAWRAAAMWRTSWLSRECIVLPAFMGAVAVYGITHYLGWPAAGGTQAVLSAIVGASAALLCITLFICTGMIYVCIKFLQEWATPLTIVNFMLLGAASGCALASVFAFVTAPHLAGIFGIAAMILTVAALVGRAASLYRNARLKPVSSLQSATGIRHPRIVQKSQGAMGGSFNTRQYFHGKTMQFVRSVKWVFLVLVFPVPLLLLAAGMMWSSLALLALAFLLQYVGLIAERWFFFAQANHPQNMYYQQIS